MLACRHEWLREACPSMRCSCVSAHDRLCLSTTQALRASYRPLYSCLFSSSVKGEGGRLRTYGRMCFAVVSVG